MGWDYIGGEAEERREGPGSRYIIVSERLRRGRGLVKKQPH